jgi:hypothetical protein
MTADEHPLIRATETGVLLVMLLILSIAMLAVVPFALLAGLHTNPVVSQQIVIFAILFTGWAASRPGCWFAHDDALAWFLSRGCELDGGREPTSDDQHRTVHSC